MIKKFGQLYKTITKIGKMCLSLAKKHQMYLYLSLQEDSLLVHANLEVVGSSEISFHCLVESEKKLFRNININEDFVFTVAKAVKHEGQ